MNSPRIIIICSLLILGTSTEALAGDTVGSSILDRCRRVLTSLNKFMDGPLTHTEFQKESQNPPLEVILKALKIDPAHVDSQWTVLSLGEGMSPLLPFLLKNGVRAKGVDSHYTDDVIMQYQEAYGDVVRRASATATGFPPNSFDLVVSHRMVNNLSLKENIAVIDEALRIVKPREGEVRLYEYGPKYVAILSKYLLAVYGRQITFHFESVIQEWVGQSGAIYKKGGNLLVIEKSVAPLVKRYAPILKEMDPRIQLKM